MEEQTLKLLTTIMHSVFCVADHSVECNWYSEEVLGERWKEPSHKKWIEKTQEILEMFEIDDDSQEAIKIMQIMTTALKMINVLKNRSPKAHDYFIKFLKRGYK